MGIETLLQEMLSSDSLPTLPTVASKLITLTAKEDTTLSDIAKLISQDMSLSARILKVSNSSFYSHAQEIGSINQAVSILGMNAVRSLVLSFSFFTMRADKKKQSRFNFGQFWERSLTAAVAAKLILEKVSNVDTDEIFVAGLLQNLGQLVLARSFITRYDSVLCAVEDNQYDILAAEEDVFGTNHTEVGAELARHWGFPWSLQAPIRYHHDPKKFPETKNRQLRATVCATYLSDLIANILFSNMPETYHKRFRQEAAELLQLNGDDITTILDQVHIRLSEAGEYFNLRIEASRSIQEILQEANIRLSLINLDYDQMNKQLIQAKIHLENLTRQLEEKNRFLDDLANLDGLTEVFNHRYFQSSLDLEIDRAMRNGSPLSLLLIDIDHFKKFNDDHGHQAGDFVLKRFAAIIRKNIRKEDIVARYGGEEFAVILPKTDAEQAGDCAEKLRSAVDETTIADSNETYHVTASFGCATAAPATDELFSKNAFITMADQALYEAKEKGRNRVQHYSPRKRWFSF